MADASTGGLEQAIILAGGAGTRLQSVVSDVPKPMAPICGRPFMEYLLGQLREAGVARAVVLAGYMAGSLRDHFGDGARWGVSIDWSVESEPRGTAGALKLAQPLLDGERWLLMNGDSFFDISLADLLAAHLGSPASVTLALASVSDAGRYGGVTRAPDGRITAFVEKPDVSHASAPKCINGGLYIIDRTTLDLIPADRPVSFERDVLPLLVGSETGVHGVEFDGYFVDIGVPDDYHAAQGRCEVFARLAPTGAQLPR